LAATSLRYTGARFFAIASACRDAFAARTCALRNTHARKFDPLQQMRADPSIRELLKHD
jgi:hypothetical protein